MSFSPRLVLVTAPDLAGARRIAGAVLQPRLAACVSIVPAIESHYWWKDKLEAGSEVLLLIKSSAEQFDALVDGLKANHSYECPEIVSLVPEEIAPAYRAWWEKETR